MQLTRAADYAVRATIHLASLEANARTSLTGLSDSTGVGPQFLSKVLQQLVRSGLVISRRGGTGGFSLARPAEEISLLDVIEAIEGATALNFCLASGDPCERSGWCAAHLVWARAQAAMMLELRSASIARLAAETARLRDAWGVRADPVHFGRPAWS